MEIIWGRRALWIDAPALDQRLARYRHVLIDIGTGDGRFVRHVATTQADTFALGIDACREQLADCSRRAPANALFAIANAAALPAMLGGRATSLTINFPWGSLLEGLLDEGAVLVGLAHLARPGASLEVRVNAGALAELGCALDEGAHRIRRALGTAGFAMRRQELWGAPELRACPTTWARRLAFGRDPRALALTCRRAPQGAPAT